jgi:anti-anti-sigma factor
VRPRCHEIQIEGELDMAVADRLREALERVPQDTEHVLLGLSRCEFVDSTGIAVIVHAELRMSREGRRLLVYGPSREARRIFSMAGLTERGILFDEPEGALSACAEAA